MRPSPTPGGRPTTVDLARALAPTLSGRVRRDGVSIAYEVFGSGPRTVVLLPTWSGIHSRMWKLQVPYLARHLRVVTFDGRGNGASDRPVGAEAYTVDAFAEDIIAVMDATKTASAALVGLSCGVLWEVAAAAEHPDRVDRIACLASGVPLAPGHPERAVHPFEPELDTDTGWAKYNAAYWARAYRPFLEFFAAECLSEPHSTKGIEDFVAWGLETSPEALADATRGIAIGGTDRWIERLGRVRCPTLVIHGDDDHVRPLAQGAALAEATGGELVTLVGAGHLPHLRHPARVNLLLREFLAPRPAPSRWTRSDRRPCRVLFVSSPIGLGHARRDLAIARELRRRHPDLEIDWLAQPPLTTVLQRAGERIHPASARLAGEAAHIAACADGHRLDCFEAIRRMDEILLANFMVFHDLVVDEPYDVWIGDEAWELDYHLHENPECKTAPFVWLTDFVGWLPMPEGGPEQARLTADLNAEMVEHVARHPSVRDRAIFVGEPADLIPESLGPGLPSIPEWTTEHFRFCGHITGAPREESLDRAGLRARFGHRDDEPVCVVAVGGSGIGETLLRCAIDALPMARALVPGLRMVAVAGPRIDPGILPTADGLEVLPHVDRLDLRLAAADVAVVQGGLTTAMELIAAGRPFVSVPLAAHFEQNLHVRHRLARHGHTSSLSADRLTPEAVARAIADTVGREVDYVPVPTDGAAVAAAIISELL